MNPSTRNRLCDIADSRLCTCRIRKAAAVEKMDVCSWTGCSLGTTVWSWRTGTSSGSPRLCSCHCTTLARYSRIQKYCNYIQTTIHKLAKNMQQYAIPWPKEPSMQEICINMHVRPAPEPVKHAGWGRVRDVKRQAARMIRGWLGDKGWWYTN